jgi:hypothetical protein
VSEPESVCVSVCMEVFHFFSVAMICLGSFLCTTRHWQPSPPFFYPLNCSSVVCVSQTSHLLLPLPPTFSPFL